MNSEVSETLEVILQNNTFVPLYFFSSLWKVEREWSCEDDQIKGRADQAFWGLHDHGKEMFYIIWSSEGKDVM